MSLLDSFKKKKKQEPKSLFSLVDATSLLPEQHEAQSPPPENPNGSEKHIGNVPGTDPEPPSPSQTSSPSPSPPGKRKYRIRRFRKTAGGSGSEKVVTDSTGKAIGSHTDPRDLVESSHLDQGKRDSLFRRLRSSPRDTILSSLSIPDDLEDVGKLTERVSAVHSVHIDGEYDQLKIIQSGINEISRSSRVLSSLAMCLHLLEGDELRNQGDIPAATTAYDRALKFASGGASENPGMVTALRLELGNISLHSDDFSSALSHYQKAHEHSDSGPETLINLAVVHAMMNDHSASRSYIDRSLDHGPDDPDALFIKGVVQYYEGDTTGAVETWKRTLEIDPGNDEIRKYIGRFYLDIGDFAKAIESMEQIVKDHPDDLEVWNLLGLAYTELGDSEHAVTSYKRGLGVDDSELAHPVTESEVSPDIHQEETADTTLKDDEESSEQPAPDQTASFDADEETERCWNEALDLSPSVHDGRDMDPDETFQEDSAYSKAVECFEKLVDGDGSDHIAWYNLASARALKGEIEESADSLEKAISLHEPYRERALQDRDFSDILESPLFKKILAPPEDRI